MVRAYVIYSLTIVLVSNSYNTTVKKQDGAKARTATHTPS